MKRRVDWLGIATIVVSFVYSFLWAVVGSRVLPRLPTLALRVLLMAVAAAALGYLVWEWLVL